MAQTFEVEVNGTTYNLNNSSPFRLASMAGGGPSSVNRFGRRDALWGGMVDAGYRVGSSGVTLSLNFYASTNAILDTYRQLLFAIFCPTPDIPIYLKVTRDDGTVRTLETYTTGNVEIAIAPEEAAAHLHRATVRLRAAKPTWRAAAASSASLAGSANDWWLAGGLIGTANVLEHVEYPAQAQAWAWVGTAAGPWTIVFRTAKEVNTAGHAAFRSKTYAGTAALNDPIFYRYSTSWSLSVNTNSGVTDMPSGTRNYAYYHNFEESYVHYLFYDGTAIFLSELDLGYRSLIGTAGAWRGELAGAGTTLWENAMPKAAIYNIALSQAQRVALDAHMADTPILGTISAVNSGDIPISPLITMYGPLVNPIITNVTTGQVIDFSGMTLGSAESCYIDLTTGNKTVMSAGGSSLMSYMGTPAQLANFHLAPSPIAAGGTNSIRVQGGSTTVDSRIEFQHYNRYMSF